MQKQSDPRNPFANAFAAWQAQRQDPTWVSELRQDAFTAFDSSGLPTRRDEEWKYTSLRPVRDINYSLAAVLADSATVLEAISDYIVSDETVLVFVNGQPSLSNSNIDHKQPGLTLTSLTDALSSHGDYLRPRLQQSLMAAQPFTRLNAAFLGNGTLLELAPNTVCERPLHILHVSTSEAHDTAQAPRHFLVLGEGSELKLTETFVSAAGQTRSFTNSHTDIQIAPGARLQYSRIDLQGESALHVGRGRIELGRNASLDSFCYSAGGRLSRYDLDVVLAGEGADAELNGLYLTKAGQVVDHHTTVHHLVPNATSRQLYKGILDGDSRAVFNGKVVVTREAQGTNAQQLNRNLLLSADAEIDTKPELMIDADDVKCSHGASIGQLDEDQIFYLRSRGLTTLEARKLLTTAFADDVLLKAPHVRKRLRSRTMGYFT